MTTCGVCQVASATWIGLKDGRGAWFVVLGRVARRRLHRRLTRIGMAFDGFRPDRYDLTGSAICLIGVAVIMYAPRP